MNWNNSFGFFVTDFFKLFISIERLFLSTSTSTTFAPVNFTAFAVATNVMLGTMTSSPFCIPNAFNARNNAEVPLVVDTANFGPNFFFIFIF